ncbi:peptidylprolyl isomerase [Paraglaciecola psychrophila]|uniref:Peptidyl-prolyl cis-trans isomerase n=1 Tax=Paraglaciecola psychrophila 170 TaxID=1129794 RepID=K7A8J7_9ALTE|nr:peptidylprolyl isomerase [Paraglaciecola psychrophila]AGH46648.1 peptidyl-prolyl cis-trans isomerase, cyclophilin-type [Paraglaciecola psychrophila 170]GAC38637.1 peptidyl-prolyl cis-trans isomerase-like 1 [Paraglaciecola psychrophila 170]
MNAFLPPKTQLLVVFFISFIISGCDLFQDQAIKQADQFILQKNIDKTNQDWKTSLPKPTTFTFSQDKAYLWHLKTSKGDILIEFMPNVAPTHVSSTIYLTSLGYYDNTIFHRIIPGFMAQGGDPTGTGKGNPGYQYAGEFSDELKHTQGGLLSMANSGPNTDGSQFFLTFTASPWLDGKHTIFGKVVQGMDVLESLKKYGSRSGKTNEKVSIITATILVK